VYDRSQGVSILRARHPVTISAPYRLLRLLTLLRDIGEISSKGCPGTHLRHLRIWRCGASLLSQGPRMVAMDPSAHRFRRPGGISAQSPSKHSMTSPGGLGYSHGSEMRSADWDTCWDTECCSIGRLTPEFSLTPGPNAVESAQTGDIAAYFSPNIDEFSRVRVQKSGHQAQSGCITTNNMSI